MPIQKWFWERKELKYFLAIFSARWKEILSELDGEQDKNFLKDKALYNRTYAEKTDNPEAWFWLVFYLLEMDDYQECIKVGKKAWDLSPSREYLGYNLGLCYAKLGQSKIARKYFNKELIISPNDEDVKLEIAKTWLADKQPKQAIDVLTQLLKHHKNIDALTIRATAYEQTQQTTLAIQDYRQLIRINPHEDKFLNHYVRLKGELESKL